MTRKWAFKGIEGIAETNESAIRLDASLAELIVHMDRVLSCPDSSCLPERQLDRLHSAFDRAKSLLTELRDLHSRMGRLLNICEIAFPEAENLKKCSNWESACRKFTQADLNRFMEGLLELLRQAKGLGAAIEIASRDIARHLESNDDQNSSDIAEEPEDDSMTICSPHQDSEEEDDLSARVEDLWRTVEEELDWLRELDADLRDVKKSLNARCNHIEAAK